MPHTAPAGPSATRAPRRPGCRRPAAERGHRAAAGELAALAFLTPVVPAATGAAPPAVPDGPAVPHPRPAGE